VGSVVRLGATPVFADIDPLTYNLDPDEVAAKITPRTKAILPVHLFGQCAAMDRLSELANEHNIRIIEDAAQSFGATYKGRPCGGLADIGCFSFYPSKNLGTLGDGGMVTTNDAGLAAKLKALRNHGSEVKYYHKYVGWNARLDTIHAAMLRVKLPLVNGWLDARRKVADRYDVLLSGTGLGLPARDPDAVHTFNQYVVRVGNGRRDGLLQHLKANQIGCEVYYPLSLHQQECMKFLGYRTGDFPVSEAAAKDVLALPMYPELPIESQQRVADVVKEYLTQPMRKAA
jgi:dTDP-4-amino-4,6-dideoxygalactose transaminase